MKEITFPGQHPNEKVVMIVRRHPIVLLFPALTIAILSFLPIIYFFGLPSLMPLILEPPFVDLAIFIAVIWYWFIWVFFFVTWFNYYYDFWILTTERILDIDQVSLFNRVVSEVRLERIQDMTSEVPGFIPTLLNFGNLFIQSAGEMERFAMEQISNPVEMRRTISNLQEQSIKGGPAMTIGKTSGV